MIKISRHLPVCASALLAAILSGLPLDGFAAEPCPTALADLSAVLAIEDAAARAEAAECFIEDSVLYDFPDLEPVVRVMLHDEESRVRWTGLSVLGASVWAGKTTGADMRQWMSETLVAVLATDPSTGNRGLTAILIGEMDVIPENQVRAPLLDLLSQSDTKAARDALNTLQRFSQPPLCRYRGCATQ